VPPIFRNSRFAASRCCLRHERITPQILPELQSIIDVSPCCGDMTFLVTEYGRPFTAAGLGNWFRHRWVEAGGPGRAHGLRKAGATIAAMNGATTRQLMACFAWDSIKMAEKYTSAAEQERHRRESDALHQHGRTDWRRIVSPFRGWWDKAAKV